MANQGSFQHSQPLLAQLGAVPVLRLWSCLYSTGLFALVQAFSTSSGQSAFLAYIFGT
jgi:hypothetical protein